MTRHEQRCENVNKTLFEITLDMPEELKLARIGVFNSKIDEEKSNNVIVNNKKYNFRNYDQDQIFFLTVTKDKFLNENHPAVIIDKIVERLDLTILYERYSEEGNPAYHPKMMLKVLFYAYYDGIMSARTIWDAVIHRSDFIYLSAGEVPDFRTINRFRLKHIGDLPYLFTQIVMLCKRLEMIDFKNMAIDGEKIQANASYRNSKNLKGIKKEYEAIKEGMKKLLEKEVNEYFTEDKKVKRISRLENKLEKLEYYKKMLEEIGDEEERINIVDKDAKVMRHKDGQKLPSYTHQSGRDEKVGVVMAVQSTQSVDEPKDLVILTDRSIENSGEKHKNVIADSSFSSYEILEEIENREESFFVPDRRNEVSKKREEEKKKYGQEDFKKNERDEIICPNGCRMEEKRVIKDGNGYEKKIYEGTRCDNCNKKGKCTNGVKRTIYIDSRIELRDKMREKLSTDEGREIYMKRQWLIEPMHGDEIGRAHV